jgi:hypothetical protein
VSLHQRKMSQKSIRHTAPNSDQHAKDVAQAKQLARSRKRIIVSAPINQTAPAAKAPCLAGHANGWQYIAEGGKLVAVPEAEFVSFQEEIRRTRTRYVTQRFDKKLGRNRMTFRKLDRESPLAQFALTLSPPFSETLKRLDQMFRYDQKPNRALEITYNCLDRIGTAAVNEYQRITGRIVTGLGIHLDTMAPHLHLPNTRIDENLQLVGDKGQGTSGSLFVIYRELQLGIIDSKSERAVDFFAKMEQFETQRGRLPVDIQMCSFIDKVAEQILVQMFPGEEQDIRELLQDEKDNYRRNRRQQDAAALDDKEKELLADLAAVRHEKAQRNIKLGTPEIILPVPPVSGPSI